MDDTKRFAVPPTVRNVLGLSVPDQSSLAFVAIQSALRPYMESDVVRAIEVTYWRDGADMPILRHIFTSQAPNLDLEVAYAPEAATYLVIRGSLGDG